MHPPWPAIEPAHKSLAARTCLNKIYESLQLQTQIPRTISSVNDTEITSTHMLEVEFLIYPCYTDMLNSVYIYKCETECQATYFTEKVISWSR